MDVLLWLLIILSVIAFVYYGMWQVPNKRIDVEYKMSRWWYEPEFRFLLCTATDELNLNEFCSVEGRC